MGGSSRAVVDYLLHPSFISGICTASDLIPLCKASSLSGKGLRYEGNNFLKASNSK